MNIEKIINSGKITLDEKTVILQKQRFITDTYPDKIRALQLEIIELQQAVSDAKDICEKVSALEVKG
jgi:hypothetical protein|tara:strand:+ start:1834 stop:2034 length:201 start_codon:yes stop_codon:yes gene_type:complete